MVTLYHRTRAAKGWSLINSQDEVRVTKDRGKVYGGFFMGLLAMPRVLIELLAVRSGGESESRVQVRVREG